MSDAPKPLLVKIRGSDLRKHLTSKIESITAYNDTITKEAERREARLATMSTLEVSWFFMTHGFTSSMHLPCHHYQTALDAIESDDEIYGLTLEEAKHLCLPSQQQ